MPVSPELLSALRAYERLWRSDASDADVEAAFGQLARRAGSSREHASKKGKGAPAWRSTRSW